MTKIEIHGTIASQPTRSTLIVAKAIGLDFEFKELVPLEKTAEFKKFNPQQLIPVLVDDGFILPESRAIMKYLIDKYSKDDALYPKDLKQRALVDARLDFDNGTLWPKVRGIYRKILDKDPKESFQVVHDALEVIEEFLTRNKWIAGSKLTIADISFSSTVSFLQDFEFDLSRYPKILEWLKECRKNIPNYNLQDQGNADLKAILPLLRQYYK